VAGRLNIWGPAHRRRLCQHRKNCAGTVAPMWKERPKRAPRLFRPRVAMPSMPQVGGKTSGDTGRKGKEGLFKNLGENLLFRGNKDGLIKRVCFKIGGEGKTPHISEVPRRRVFSKKDLGPKGP